MNEESNTQNTDPGDDRHHSGIAVIVLIFIFVGMNCITTQAAADEGENPKKDDTTMGLIEHLTKESLEQILGKYQIVMQRLGTTDDAEVYQVMLGCQSFFH